jgi:hypothetical protein
MKRLIGKLMLGLMLGASLWSFSAAPAKADDYWNRHWGWYDNSYRPYYYRHRYAPPAYGYGYQYGPTYYGPGPGRYRQRTYYYSRPGGAVQIGPLNFGWW